jgi:hypothetical protein
MMRLVALAGFAVAVATSAQAMPRTTPVQTGSLVTQVRQGCGTGMVRVNGQCVSRPDMRVERGNNYGTNGNGGYPSGMCYRQGDQDTRGGKLMPCASASDSPAYVDTPGVRVIMRARERWGPGTWYAYATKSGIVCMPGTKITMGGQEHLCQ